MINNDEYYMAIALKEAILAYEADEVPVGAVVVHNGQIIAKAHNQIKMLKDPTAHAEMIAITQAAAALESERLVDCDMYSTLEPCAMCAGAMVLARIKRLFISSNDPKTGAAGSVFNIVSNDNLNHRVEVIKGMLSEQTSMLMQDFFKNKRMK
ncbi:MAG: tRNA adenosine(34) deaminase TadA [Candidatus Omnitrophica bacterium]|nr:tRNA adenosine(34) deaminase TadA [Candidatus Omnitrophota bacterium]